MDPIVSADGSHSLISRRYGEAYRSRNGARSESWHVFVAGSGVAARLAAGHATTVLELGFGTARNFAASAEVALAFGTPLRYVAFEHDLLPAEAWAAQELDALGPPPLRAALIEARSAWDAESGARFELRFGPVSLLVQVVDATEAALPTGVDAVYLDGFSPAVNPEMWSDALMARAAASLAPGGTAVSYCVQGEVRRALEGAGLEVERRRGPPGGKREVLWARRPAGRSRADVRAAPLAGTRLAVVGGGVAGSTLALAAARAGASVDLFDAADGLGGASGVPAALVNPYRGRSGRASLADRLGAARTWALAWSLHLEGLDPGAHPVGVVRLADQARQARAWRQRPGAIPFGPELEPEPGRWRAPHGGMLVPVGGWIDPPRWLGALRRAAEALGARWHHHTAVQDVSRGARGGWSLGAAPRLEGDDGEAYDKVALCLGASAPGALPHLRVAALPGAVALLPGYLPAKPLAGAVYAAPVGSAERYGLDPRQPWLAVGGGSPARATGFADLRAALAWTLPSEPQELVATWSGLRARGRDSQPEVVALDEGLWWFGSFGGRGFLRAASEAERLVEHWTLGGS